MGMVIGLVCRTVCLTRLGKYVVSYAPSVRVGVAPPPFLLVASAGWPGLPSIGG